MSAHHLAHLNVAIVRETLDHPSMANFVAQLGPVNELARTSPGFIWMPEGEEAGSATAVFGSERALPNLSVWKSVDDLQRFVYQGLHGQLLDKRNVWFEQQSGPAYVLWWIPAGHRPDLAEGRERLEYLAVHGPTPEAFTFAESFASPENSGLRGQPPLPGEVWAR